jgi:hypothetical protein
MSLYAQATTLKIFANERDSQHASLRLSELRRHYYSYARFVRS